MFKKTSLFLTAVLLALALSAAPASSQCYFCHCCYADCHLTGAFMGDPGPMGFTGSGCAQGCGEPCAEEETSEVAAFDLEGVWTDLNTLDVEKIRIHLKDHPTRLALNKERDAIQLLGCRDGVIGHLQLPKDVIFSLLSEEDL